MEVTATAKYVRVQPRKVRIIADEIRGKNALHATSLLRYHTGKGAKELRKVMVSAMANAEANHGLSPELLKVATITVDEGPRLKRMTQKAMGRGARIIKKTSHITVGVAEGEVEVKVKPHGTKAKARPTLAAPTPKGGKKKAAAQAEQAEEAPVVEAMAEETPVVEATAEVTEPTETAEPVVADEAEASEDKGAE
jgi:large subunit ribosomal protein L22